MPTYVVHTSLEHATITISERAPERPRAVRDIFEGIGGAGARTGICRAVDVDFAADVRAVLPRDDDVVPLVSSDGIGGIYEKKPEAKSGPVG